MKSKFIDPRLTKQHLHVSMVKPYILVAEDLLDQNTVKLFLEKIGINREYFLVANNWVSLDFFNDFLDCYAEHGDLAELNKKAGEKALSPEYLGLKYHLIKNIGIKNALKQFAHFGSRLNKTRSYEVQTADKSSALLKISLTESDLLPKHRETDLNWQSSIESMASLAAGSKVDVQMVESPYDGHSSWLWEVKWKNSANFLYTPQILLFAIFVLTVFGAHYIYFKEFYSVGLLLFVFAAFTSFLLYNGYRIFKDYKLLRNEYDQFEQNASHRYSDLEQAKISLDHRYQESRLIEKTSKEIQKNQNLNELLDASLQAICGYFNFDRAMIMLVDEKKQKLKTVCVAGLHVQNSDLWSFEVDVTKERSGEKFISSVFRNNSEVLIEDVAKHLQDLNQESRQLLLRLKSRSFAIVAVPAQDGNWGVILADKIKEGKVLKHADLVLLKRVAQHLGLALDKESNIEQERKLRSAFEKFVPKEVVQRIQLKSHKETLLGGGKRNVAAMFLDIRGFTKLSHDLSTIKCIEMLNDFFTMTEEKVSSYGALIDKFLGDGVMITWGTFSKITDYDKIYQCALEINKGLEELNKQFALKGLPRLEIGIGLHVGDAMVGNIGSRKRMEFTCIGSTINFASRLESLCKAYDCQLVLSEEFWQKLSLSRQSEFEIKNNVEIRGLPKKVKVAIKSFEKEKIKRERLVS